jgi:hypothetical protein
MNSPSMPLDRARLEIRASFVFMRRLPGSGWRRRGAFAIHGGYRKFISPNVIFRTFGRCKARLGSTQGKVSI